MRLGEVVRLPLVNSPNFAAYCGCHSRGRCQGHMICLCRSDYEESSRPVLMLCWGFWAIPCIERKSNRMERFRNRCNGSVDATWCGFLRHSPILIKAYVGDKPIELHRGSSVNHDFVRGGSLGNCLNVVTKGHSLSFGFSLWSFVDDIGCSILPQS